MKNILFKELLQVLVTLDCYTIRIDTYNTDTMTTIKQNIYNMNEIPNNYDNSEVLTIHSSRTYESKLYDYFITVNN